MALPTGHHNISGMAALPNGHLIAADSEYIFTYNGTSWNAVVAQDPDLTVGGDAVEIPDDIDGATGGLAVLYDGAGPFIRQDSGIYLWAPGNIAYDSLAQDQDGHWILLVRGRDVWKYTLDGQGGNWGNSALESLPSDVDGDLVQVDENEQPSQWMVVDNSRQRVVFSDNEGTIGSERNSRVAWGDTSKASCGRPRPLNSVF